MKNAPFAQADEAWMARENERGQTSRVAKIA